ncbi:MAG: VWA domain-containing protein [Candidatus Micrarchaeia archaeon]|jgi:Ca-activated chloride channel family protein
MAGFDDPEVLLLLVAIPILLYAYKAMIERRKKEAVKFGNLALIKSALGDKKKLTRASILFYLSLLSLGLLVIGFANPMIELEQEREGVNVVLVLDVSGSMQATDYAPNRLEAAKNSAGTLIDSLKPKDNVGIVIFESGATTAAYLSPFKEKVKEKLLAISPRQGSTALGDGLGMGIDMALSIPNKRKVVILLSDGVNNAGVVSPQEAAKYAKANNIQVYAIGMGSDGQAILGYDWFGNPQYAELDEATLQLVAQETGGKYFKSVDSKTLDGIYENISKDIKREKEQTNVKDWFFATAALVLLAELYLRYAKNRVIQ